MKTCKFDNSPIRARGLCGKCYQRAAIKGTLQEHEKRWGSHEDRFNRYLNIGFSEVCWEWLGPISNEGYGLWRTGRYVRTQMAHRVSYNKFVGKIPEKYEIDHLCRNRKCVNPNHLEAVPKRINILRGVGVGAKNRLKHNCPKGHPYVQRSWGRCCLTCHRESSRQYKLRQKQKTV